MFKKLCENLKSLMIEKSINASELARSTGLPASTIKKIRNYDNPNPTLATLLPITQYFSVSLSQLVGDEPLPQVKTAKPSQVPILTWKEAIAWPTTHHDPHLFAMTENIYSSYAFALRVEKEDWSMLSKETILFFDPSHNASHSDYVVVYKQDQQIPTVRQILHDEENIYLKPLTEGYPILKLTPQHKILGVMMEYRKQIIKNS